MTDARITHFQHSVENVLSHLRNEFSKLQTGRANPALVEHIIVEAYGQKQELRTVAGISVPDARTIQIQPWDRAILGTVESAIRAMELGINPVNDGAVIRINLPAMTEEGRKKMTKVVDQLAEEARISIRQQRQEIHDQVKTSEKDEDVKFSLLDELQKEVEKANQMVEDLRKKKEQEVMTV